MQTKVVNMDVQLLCEAVRIKTIIYLSSNFFLYVCIQTLHEFFMQTHLEKNMPSSWEGFELFGEFPPNSRVFFLFSLIEPHHIRSALPTILIVEKHADLSVSLFPRQNSPIVLFCWRIISTKTDLKELSFFPLYWDYM